MMENIPKIYRFSLKVFALGTMAVALVAMMKPFDEKEDYQVDYKSSKTTFASLYRRVFSGKWRLELRNGTRSVRKVV